MKTLAPIFVVLIILMAFISALNAQTSRIFNPDLPRHLVFQWRIETDAVHSTWQNTDFTITRDNSGMVVFYGLYGSLAHALAELPLLPPNVKKEDLSLVPFFNQRSIIAADAFALVGNRNGSEMTKADEETAVAFTVYFGTYERPIRSGDINTVREVLSFELQPNHTFAYSAGEFPSLESAEEYKDYLSSNGYPHAEVNKYLNGQKVAMLDYQELYAFVDWNY